MPISHLSRTTLLALALLAFGSRPLLAEHAARLTLELQKDNGAVPDARFLATQAQIIQKDEILFAVIGQLGLVEKFGQPRAKVARQLRAGLKVEILRYTALVIVVFSHADSNLAADIATAIGKEYQKQRLAGIHHSMIVELTGQKIELMDREERTRAAYRQAADLRQEFKILDTDPQTIDAVVTAEAPLEKGAMQKYLEAKGEYVRARSLLQSIEHKYGYGACFYPGHAIEPVKIRDLPKRPAK